MIDGKIIHPNLANIKNVGQFIKKGKEKRYFYGFAEFEIDKYTFTNFDPTEEQYINSNSKDSNPGDFFYKLKDDCKLDNNDIEVMKQSKPSRSGGKQTRRRRKSRKSKKSKKSRRKSRKSRK